MKKLITTIVILAFLTVGNSYAQVTASNSLTATATVNAALTIAQAAPLAFGNVAQSTTPVIAYNAAGAGVLSITGTQGQAVIFTAPSTITLSDGATTPNTMTVSSLTFGTSLTSDPTDTQTVLTDLSSYSLGVGTNYLSVGGTLTVDTNQVAGTYTGTATVTVAYNI